MFAKDMQVLLGTKFGDCLASLSKEIKAQVMNTIMQLQNNPELPGLNVEKIGSSGVQSARVNDNYRMIFTTQEDSKLFIVLYVGTHNDAYQFANRYKVEINPITGGLQQVEISPRRITTQPGTGKRLSRLAALSDEQMEQMSIPEEHRPQLREKVFTTGQLLGFRQYLPENTYDVLEFIIEGTPVEDALDILASLNEPVIPVKIEEKKPLFEAFSAEELVSVGIPMENADAVRHIKTDKELEIIAASLPLLARQALYALKSGETIEDIRKSTYSSAKQNTENDYKAAADSPITLAEFAPIHSEEALRAFMEYPREKWRVFLHPTQTEIIRQDYNGPARIIGGAGTGKTVVIVHRAARLAAECTGDEKILVTTFGNTLKHDIDERIRYLCSEDRLAHIDVYTVDRITYELSKAYLRASIAYPGDRYRKLEDTWIEAMAMTGLSGTFTPEFCADEWRDVIQAQNITSPDRYVAAQRYGRGRALDRASREKFWTIAEAYKNICSLKSLTDSDWVQNRLADYLRSTPNTPRYKTVIVDECQDLRAPALRMLRALAGEQHKNDMYLSGDTRQRIYGGRASLSQCGIMVNNRSRVLKLNYRTTAEIYELAMQFQRGFHYDDMDGKTLSKDKCNCVFHGPRPTIYKYNSEGSEMADFLNDITEVLESGVPASDICVMARTVKLVLALRRELIDQGFEVLMVERSHPDDKSIDGIRLMTMHRGKGMEYSYVYLPCLRADLIPPEDDIAKAEDETVLNEIMLSEANLLSVAITRAKHRVWLSFSGETPELIQKYVDDDYILDMDP